MPHNTNEQLRGITRGMRIMLDQARARTGDFFERCPLPAVVANSELFLRANPAMCRLLGYEEDELLARPWAELTHPDDFGRTARVAAAMAQGQPADGFENRYLCKERGPNGEKLWRRLRWFSSPWDADGFTYAIALDLGPAL